MCKYFCEIKNKVESGSLRIRLFLLNLSAILLCTFSFKEILNK